MVTVCDFVIGNDLNHFVVVFTVFGINYMVARFPRVVITCNCILDFE